MTDPGGAGGPGAGAPRTVDLAELASDVLTGPPRLGRVHLVVVDGPSGSGKTTLAGRLLTAAATAEPGVRAALVHLDDLYEGWSGLHADRGHGTVSQRLLGDLLEPLAAGRSGRWRRYDWNASGFAEWHTVEPPDLLVIEGCGSADPGYRLRTSLQLWVEAAPELRLRRGIERDGEDLRDHWRAWQREEDGLFAARRTRAIADLRIDGAPTVPHDRGTQIVLLD